MKGSIVKRTTATGAPRYYAVFRDDGGKQKWRGFDRQKDAERFLTSNVKAVQDGTYREIRPITFTEYAERWIAGLGASVKPSTARAYRSILERRLIPALGARAVSTITATEVNQLLAACEGALKPKTRRNVLTLLHKVLDDARAAGYCAINPLADRRAVRRPRALRPEEESEVEILSPAEVNRLLEAVAPDYQPLYLVAVSTGMRLGEVLGLQWGDVDRAAQQLRVRRSLYKGECYLPKSKGSRRSLDVGDQVLGTLNALERSRYG